MVKPMKRPRSSCGAPWERSKGDFRGPVRHFATACGAGASICMPKVGQRFAIDEKKCRSFRQISQARFCGLAEPLEKSRVPGYSLDLTNEFPGCYCASFVIAPLGFRSPHS